MRRETEEGGEVDMIQAFAEMIEDGRQQGLQQGLQQGRQEKEALRKLNLCLIADNRIDDLKKANEDAVYCRELCCAYAIE